MSAVSDPSEPARILLVEDDDNLRLTLADVLRDHGWSVAAAADAGAARSLLASASFDVVILDVMLPDGDGYTLCTELKRAAAAKGAQVPRVLMLTARTLEDDLVRGFDAGADDYLKKPYRLRELVVRVRALARRSAAPIDAKPAHTALGSFRIDRAGRRVVDEHGAEVALTPTEIDLLVLLVDSAGVALSRNEILDRVWGKDVVVDERTVDNFVSSLKKKPRWTPGSPFSIKTVRGVGYRMELAA